MIATFAGDTTDGRFEDRVGGVRDADPQALPETFEAHLRRINESYDALGDQLFYEADERRLSAEQRRHIADELHMLSDDVELLALALEDAGAGP